jgi:hypothetical protein
MQNLIVFICKAELSIYMGPLVVKQRIIANDHILNICLMAQLLYFKSASLRCDFVHFGS